MNLLKKKRVSFICFEKIVQDLCSISSSQTEHAFFGQTDEGLSERALVEVKTY